MCIKLRKSATTEPPLGTNAEKLQEYLDCQMKITCQDGRTFLGYFKCIDNLKNIILSDTQEMRNDLQRHVGMIMVPGKHIQRVLVKKDDDYI